MNPNEALSLGSISQIVMPSDLRKVLGEHMEFHIKHYTPEPLNSVQRVKYWGSTWSSTLNTTPRNLLTVCSENSSNLKHA